MIAFTHKSATFSDCGDYRYTLDRWWIHDPRDGAYVNFIGLNPSTADEVELDPTCRRCVGFAQDWGYDGYVMTNLFAYRSTSPKKLLMVHDPVGGQENDDAILRVAKGAGMVVAAWGVHGRLHDRGRRVIKMLDALKIRVHCLGLTRDGHPRHPLYLKGATRPVVLLSGL